ncbi:hypothetical protein GCM10009541_18900 [Micromonospora gifhornensis]|uniref:Signal peptidase I n=1 Tax=Micromonospora gifhornensis TaxID=84594 RepID=A0ABQ4IGK9_9ACTN|nr:signal peptidase I [Micromonospora gifhornensis]GIJ16863.1 hypothetical protein Vgi01_35470 [Micromonospora gifhornensis]
MTDLPPRHAETAEQLRALAATAAATISTRPELARQVLNLARRRRRLRRTAIATAGGLAVLTTLAATTLLGRADHFTVIQPSNAMSPTVTIGDRLVFDRTLSPSRGDVVLLRRSDNGRDFDAVMRVLGLPGDTVGCPAGPDGRCPALLVNGAALTEPYVAGPTDPFPTVDVPPGRVFVVGDNRPVSYDSRAVGPEPLDAVTGVAVRIRGNDGQDRPVPGAPHRDGPGDRDNVDPPGPIPPAQVSEPD